MDRSDPGAEPRLFGFPRTVFALGLASLLTDLSSEMIYPLLPVFLVSVLGAGAVALGVVEGVAESTAAFLKIVSGRLTDRTGRRKPFVVAGYGLSGTARPLIGAAGAWPMVVVLRFIDRLGKGIRTSPRDALIADVTEPAHRGAAYGFHRAMDHAGAVTGPLVAAGLLLIPAMTLRGVFFLAAVPAVLVMVVLVTMVSDRPGTRERAAADDTRPVPLRALGPDFRRMLVALVIFTLGNSTDAFLLLRFSDAGVSATGIALLWSAHHVVKMASNVIGGRRSDTVGRKPLVLAGWLLYAAVYLGFAAFDSLGVMIGLFMIYGVYYGMTEGVERSWVAALAPKDSRGTAFGWYNGAIGLAALPASLLFGALYATAGPATAFAVGAALAGLASLVLLPVPDATPDAVAA